MLNILANGNASNSAQHTSSTLTGSGSNPSFRPLTLIGIARVIVFVMGQKSYAHALLGSDELYGQCTAASDISNF